MKFNIVKLLNEWLKIDYDACVKTVMHRVDCNAETINHPFITVDDKNTVSMLGFLNGLVMDGTKIGYEYNDETGKILQFYIVNIGATKI